MENNAKNCRALLQAVDEADFYMQDLKLYLDTHPNDEAAIEMFGEACKQYKTCKESFEECCFALNPCASKCDCRWDWLDGAWPPERV